MLLANTTPLAATLSVTPSRESADRSALFVAKATYRLDGSRLTLDPATPEPIRIGEEVHPHGTLPSELLFRRGDDLEILFLGSAHAPEARPVSSMRVALTVAGVRRELCVFGDRAWEGDPRERRIGAAAPFLVMPITWTRAFGGSEWISVDDESFVEVGHELNPGGKGFDAALLAERVRENLRAPDGQPPVATRTLPNVEDPSALIAAWSDSPEPAGWAPLAMNHPLRLRRSKPQVRDDVPSPVLVHGRLHLHAAAPGWTLPRVKGAVVVELEGLSPRGHESLTVPDLALRLDLLAGDSHRTLEVIPHLLTIRPDEGLVTVTHRVSFIVPAPDGTARSARLRMAQLSPHEVRP